MQHFSPDRCRWQELAVVLILYEVIYDIIIPGPKLDGGLRFCRELLFLVQFDGCLGLHDASGA